MQEDPVYQKLLQKSFIMRNYHNKHKEEKIPLVKKEATVKHHAISTFFVSTLVHLIVYPLDTIKTRIMAQNQVGDIANFLKNKTSTITTYTGLFRGYGSVMIGNICHLALKEHNFFALIAAEGLLKTWIDLSKVSKQMGNQKGDVQIMTKIFPTACFYGIMRDIVSRGCYLLMVKQLYSRNETLLNKQPEQKNNIFYFSAITGTIVSHPFDVIFTKLASQRTLKYSNLIDTPLTIIREESMGKLLSGLWPRLTYAIISTMLMANFYDSMLNIVLEVY